MKRDFGRIKDRGSNNGRIFFSTREPFEYVNKDMWINPNALDTLYIIKSSTTSRASTTTLTDDPHLSVDLPENGVFEINLNLAAFCSSATPDIKIDWNLSSVSLDGRRFSLGPSVLETDITNCNVNISSLSSLGDDNIFAASSGNASSIFENFIVSTSAVDGIITLRWAQNTSNANALYVLSGSYLTVRQLAGDVSLLKWYSENDDEWKFMI